MGAWGSGPFENDDASDWSYLLLDGGGPEVVDAALRVGTAEELEAPDASVAVAAAAVVGAASGVVVDLSDEVTAWLAGQDDAVRSGLRSSAGAAVTALDAVLDGSELAELWDEAGDDAWADGVRRLRAGLAASPGAG